MERRKNVRILVNALPGLLGRGIPVEVRELSLLGIGLETSMPLKPGGSYSLRLQDSRISELETRVVWCRLDRNGRHADGNLFTIYRAGLSPSFGR